MKNGSTFYSKAVIDRIQENTRNSEWAQSIRDDIVQRAQYWVDLSDDELWDMMFGNTIMRSWMVWSDGYCPCCRKDAVMYSWIADPVKNPWKLQCPNCGELFPKNDFLKYYKSGLDERGVFDYGIADGSLLYNEEHPDKDDPLRLFGVDDGNGYCEGDKRWRFIGTYLVHGQWKRLVLSGVNRLSEAYAVTGNSIYAHKAGILIDRIADLYPSFDFASDGIMYEGKNICPGYVCYSVDACVEAKEIIIAYDRIFDAIKNDESILEFLSAKSNEYKGITSKRTFADIQRNIEKNILQDTLDKPEKTDCNYPNTDIAYATAMMVLDWNGSRDRIMDFIREIAGKATAVDGVTGEKGLAEYSAWTIGVFAEFLEFCCLADSNFLLEMYRAFPIIHKSYRFHLDTWCLGRYYPQVGDCGCFAKPVERYLGVVLDRNPGIMPSMFNFLWRLYELSGDTDFVKLMYLHNDKSVEGLPYDIYNAEPEKIRRSVKEIIDREGSVPEPVSVNKEEWGLALLSSGSGRNARTLWMHYDTLRNHYHYDAFNIGLFAKGLDLMPDFGYPPVQYGGWETPEVLWYQGTASHNTVMVDGVNQYEIAGYKPHTSLWSLSSICKVARVSEPAFINGGKYERTIMLVDISDKDSYIFDAFRVAGGREHVKFIHSGLSVLDVEGLDFREMEDLPQYGLMKKYKYDPAPLFGWKADWRQASENATVGGVNAVHLAYHDVTKGAEVFTADAMVVLDGYNSRNEAYIPRLLQRRKAKGDEVLESTFAGVFEPYEDKPKLASVQRLDLYRNGSHTVLDGDLAVQIKHTDGKTDLIISVDDSAEENKLCKGYIVAEQKDWMVATDCKLLFIRRDCGDKIVKVLMYEGSFVKAGSMNIDLGDYTEFNEVSLRL